MINTWSTSNLLPYVKLQIKQQSDLDDAREITTFWTYFRENHTVVIGNKHQLQYIVIAVHCDASQTTH